MDTISHLSSGLGSNGGAGPSWFIGSNPAGPRNKQNQSYNLGFLFDTQHVCRNVCIWTM